MSTLNTPLDYLAWSDLPTYAPSITLDTSSPAAQERATALIQRAGNIIFAYYNRTGEIVQIVQEIIELTDENFGHVLHAPIQLITNSDGSTTLDPTQGDELDARYSATMYPYAALFGAPQWQVIDPTTVDILPKLGRIWMPPGLFPIPYAEARLTYRAGFCPVGGPYPEWLKQGCGMVIESLVQRSGGTVVQSAQLADQQNIKFWDNNIMTPDIKRTLSPLQLRMWR